MANFDGFAPHEITRFSSVVEKDDSTSLPLGVLAVGKNCKFHLGSVRTRDGIQNQYGFVLPDAGSVTGLIAQKVGGPAGDLQVPLAFSSQGNLYRESPAGSTLVTKITGPLVTPPANSNMQAVAAFKNVYAAFTDLVNSQGPPAVYNPQLDKLDPLSMRQVGETWKPDTLYQVGEVITPAPFVNGVASVYPVGGNGHNYICTVAGISGGPNVQPAFPVTDGGVVADNGATWKENTPVMEQALPELPHPIVIYSNVGGAGGTYPGGRDVYFLFTYVNGIGETDADIALAFKAVVNTSGSPFEHFSIGMPARPSWTNVLQVPYAITGFNIYEADVATGGPAPIITDYKLVAGSPFPIAPVDNNTPGAGANPPTVNTALVVPVGNICAGLRYMVVLFVNRNGYISGMTVAAVVSYNSPASGFQLFSGSIPTGPENTVARICAFTPAGQLNQLAGTGISNAGPYFWIPPNFDSGVFDLTKVPPGVTIAEVVNGVQMTSTLINDNTTVSATFNFTDDYLKSQVINDVSSFFRKIKVPPCSDIYYSKTIRRMFYAADNLPSGWYVSLLGDPESIYGDTSQIVQCAENNGQNRVGVREYGGIIYLLKEESGHVLTPSADDPSKWEVVEQWSGSGPCGPRAVDVGTSIMCYAHRSGPYIFTGGKPWVLPELEKTWKRINWVVGKLIWVMIDDETKEIRIGVPLDGSLVPSHIVKINYEEDPGFTNPPIFFSHFSGKWVANPASYKFCVDDIAANLAIRAKRTLQPAILGNPQLIDNATVQSQILLASSNQDGAVAAIIPDVYDDNGQGIDWVVETPSPSDMLKPSRLGGVQLNIAGSGKGGVYVLALRAKDPKEGGVVPAPGQPQQNKGAEIKLKKEWEAGVPYSCGGQLTNERLRMRITNEKRPGVWGDLKYANIYTQPVSTARPK